VAYDVARLQFQRQASINRKNHALEHCCGHKRGPQLKAPPQYSLFQHAPLLEEFLAPYPEVRIVLSTSWARVYGCENAAKRLPDGLRARVIGSTVHSRMYEEGFIAAPRGMQVWSDVLRRRPKDLVALDDDYLHWPKWCLDKYVKTHEHKGINHPSVMEEIKTKFTAMHAVQ
jgi:hypothetical protein